MNKMSGIAYHGATNHSTSDRVELDYYATDPIAVEKLLEQEEFDKKHIWEPACGGCHISKVLVDKGFYVLSSDIVDRGSPLQDVVADFFAFEGDLRNDIITNPPYSLAKEFVEHALDISWEGAKVAMLLKLTFLEGKKRKELFEKYPPKTVYVFRERIDCWRNGIKPEVMSRAVCYAWFVWVKGYQGDTVLKWI